jgi:hypothetical protein
VFKSSLGHHQYSTRDLFKVRLYLLKYEPVTLETAMCPVDPYTVSMTDVKLSKQESIRNIYSDLHSKALFPHPLIGGHASGSGAYKSGRAFSAKSQSLMLRGDSVQDMSVYRQKRQFSPARSLKLPDGAWKLMQNFYPTYRLNACHQKVDYPTNPSYIRENVIQPLKLGSAPGIKGHAHHCVDCHSYRLYAHHRNEEAYDLSHGDNGLDFSDAFGNTKFHYMAALNAPRLISMAGSDKAKKHILKLPATNQIRSNMALCAHEIRFSPDGRGLSSCAQLREGIRHASLQPGL